MTTPRTTAAPADASSRHGRWTGAGAGVYDADLRGVVRVLGGPGTGISSLLVDIATHRIAAGVDAESVLLLTGSGRVTTAMRTLEGRCVQDADRLDAIGAIGIARCFAYGGHAGRLMHDPDEPPVLHQTAAAYKASKGASLNHFYEKLFLLKDRMNTPTGRALAEQRHRFMEEFVAQFLAEWNVAA